MHVSGCSFDIISVICCSCGCQYSLNGSQPAWSLMYNQFRKVSDLRIDSAVYRECLLNWCCLLYSAPDYEISPSSVRIKNWFRCLAAGTSHF